MPRQEGVNAHGAGVIGVFGLDFGGLGTWGWVGIHSFWLHFWRDGTLCCRVIEHLDTRGFWRMVAG